MAEFFNVLPPAEALGRLLARLPTAASVGAESCCAWDALGRVAAADIVAPESLPAFARSTMDGYSVRAADTFGATDGLPAWFEVVGEVPMGAAPAVSLGVGRRQSRTPGGCWPATPMRW